MGRIWLRSMIVKFVMVMRRVLTANLLDAPKNLMRKWSRKSLMHGMTMTPGHTVKWRKRLGYHGPRCTVMQLKYGLAEVLETDGWCNQEGERRWNQAYPCGCIVCAAACAARNLTFSARLLNYEQRITLVST